MIKYIENNLIFNDRGEVMAYYELEPFHYAFLSEDDKLAIHEAFIQLMAQSRGGRIHALQIATERSIRLRQEASKELIKSEGELREIAIDLVDAQTDALIGGIGETELDYRYFIGFKLSLNSSGLSLKGIMDEAKAALKDFITQVNSYLGNSFYVMDDNEVFRYAKVAELLENRISARFRFRPLSKNDFGYIMEHLNGAKDKPYEEYEFYLPKRHEDGKTIVKKYDLLKPLYSEIEEKKRSLKITHEDGSTVYAAYFTILDIVSDLPFPSSEVFYLAQTSLSFPIDVSMNVEVLENKDALRTLTKKKKDVEDIIEHANETGQVASNNAYDAFDEISELEADLERTKEGLFKLSYVVRVTADDDKELQKRCDEIRDFYDDLSIKLVRPFGDMLGFHNEFMPMGDRHVDDYIQYVKADFLAALGFGSTQNIGDESGIYLAYTKDSGRSVYINPELAVYGLKGSITNSASAITSGALGGGKSLSMNLLVLYSVLFGAKAVILDPKSERGEWKLAFPAIADYINIINLTSEEKNRGLLDPLVIMDKPEDAKQLAIDLLTYLTGVKPNRDADRWTLIGRAVSEVLEEDHAGILKVIEKLKTYDEPEAKRLALHIESFSTYSFAKLIFSDGHVENALSFDSPLNIIQVADLVMPRADSTADEYSAVETLSVAMLMAIASFCKDFIQRYRDVFKIVFLDEAWAFLSVDQGRQMSDKLVRMGRSMKAAIYFATQNISDSRDVEKLITTRFAFRSRDPKEITDILTSFGCDPRDENNRKAIMDLENGECLYKDIWGRKAVICFHYIFDFLFEMFDTTPSAEKSYLKDYEEYIEGDEYVEENM